MSTLLPQFPYFSKTAVFLFLFSSFLVRNLRLGIICLGPLAVKKLQASEPTLPSSVPQQPTLPNLVSLIWLKMAGFLFSLLMTEMSPLLH